MNRYVSAFAIFVLLMSISSMSLDRALAVPAISLSPTSGPPGTNVTINGSAFASNAANIAILFDFQFVKEVNADANGQFSTTITIPVGTSTGIHKVTANDGTNSITADFTVTAAQTAISLSPSTGGVSTVVTVTGSNFGASKTITLRFDNNPISTNPVTVTSSSTGSFSATITIPSTATPGGHTISATDGTLSASATFNVIGSGVSISPTSGQVGTVVTVSGAEFASNAAITIRFNNNVISTNPSSVVTTGSGTFSATITIPNNATSGTHTISVTDGSKTLSAIFTVITASITLSPTSGSAGSTVTISGTGFESGSTVTVRFDTTALTTTPASVTVSTSGTFSTTVSVPSSATSGTHTIEVTDTTGKRATASFVVQTSGNITLTPSAGNRGMSVTVTGSDFTPNSDITIRLGDTTLSTNPVLVRTTSTGTFSASVIIPATASNGANTITARDSAGRTGSAIFTITTGGVITLTPNRGSSNTEVTVTGFGFNPDARMIIEFNERTMITNPQIITTDAEGRFTARFNVPSDVGVGTHIVIATDANGKVGTAQFTTEVGTSERITITPTSGSVGTRVTVQGSDFPANTAVTVRIDGNVVTTSPENVLTTTAGTFTTTITIPSLASGSHTISVTVGGRSASASFTLSDGVPGQGASITVSPTSATVGSSVTVTGSGFLPNRGVTVSIDGSLVASATTSAAGTFTALFSVLSVFSSGSHVVSASDGSNSASTTLTVIGGTSNMVTVSQARLVDQSGLSVSRPSVGMQVLIQSELRNNLSTDQQFAYIVQMKNSEGATIMISWMTGTLPPTRQYAVAQSWLVEERGDYTAEVFVWQSITNPVVLAPLQRVNFSVV